MDHLDELRQHLSLALEDCQRGQPEKAHIQLRAAVHHAAAVAKSRVLTCVYCGHDYPQDTPAHGAAVLTDHIKICERHPMRQAEARIEVLETALVGVVGTGNADQLRKMRKFLDANPHIAAEDREATLRAIDALLQEGEG